jgi:hypothetical protein
MRGAPRRGRGVTGAGRDAAPWMMYAEAGCTKVGRRGYSSTEVGSRRRASRCGPVRTTITWMGWITAAGCTEVGVVALLADSLRCRKANMEPGRCDVCAYLLFYRRVR